MCTLTSLSYVVTCKRKCTSRQHNLSTVLRLPPLAATNPVPCCLPAVGVVVTGTVLVSLVSLVTGTTALPVRHDVVDARLLQEYARLKSAGNRRQFGSTLEAPDGGLGDQDGPDGKRCC